MKQLSANSHLGKLPEIIIAKAIRVPRQDWFRLSGLLLLIFIAGLMILPAPIVYGLTAVGVGLPLLLLVWRRPDLGVVGVIFLTSGLFPPELAEIRLPFGGLELSDIAFMGLLGLVALQNMIRKSLPIPWPTVGVPLLIFLLLAVFSLFNALVFEKVATNWAFNDMRILIFYGMYFLVAWSVKKQSHLVVILISLFVVADLIAVAIILQQFLGENSFVLSAMSGGRWRIHDIGVMVRVVPAAHALMHFMAVIAFSLIIFTRHTFKLKFVYLLQFLFLNFSLLLTFTRSQWLATAIALMLMVVALIPHYKKEVIKYSLRVGLPLLLLLVCVLGFGGAELQAMFNDVPVVNEIVERAASIFTPEETLDTSSLEWREFEHEQAWISIQENPWLGVSLGNYYRYVTTLQGEALGWWTDGSLAAGEISRFTRYIHSSYVAIAVKMGIPGIAVFLWFCFAFLYYGWQLYRRLPMGLNKGLVLTILASFIGLMQWSIFHTHFMRNESTIAIGAMVGIVGSIHALSKGSAAEATGTAVTPSSSPQKLRLADFTPVFRKGRGFYGLLLFGLGLITVLWLVEPVVRNRAIISLNASNPATEVEAVGSDNVSGDAASPIVSPKLNIIQPLDLQSFDPEKPIFISWIWPTKLRADQEFTIILLNDERQFVLGTEPQAGSNNRYWLSTTIPPQVRGGEYELLIQLKHSSEAAPVASSAPRLIYILGKPAMSRPTYMPTSTSTVTPTPTAIPLPIVRIFVSSASLREGPGRNYGIVGYIYVDDVVQVIAKDHAEGEWYNVVLPDGTVGWIASNVAIPVDEAAMTAVPIAATIPPLPTSTVTPIPIATPTPTVVSPPQQTDNNPPGPSSPPPTFTPPPMP